MQYLLSSKALTQGQHEKRLDTLAQRAYILQFQVVARGVQPLLGLRDSLHMGLVSLGKEVHQLHLRKNPDFASQIFKDYTDLFKDEVVHSQSPTKS